MAVKLELKFNNDGADSSQTGADANLTNVTFASGKDGNAAVFSGSADAEVTENVINLNGNFTQTGYYKLAGSGNASFGVKLHYTTGTLSHISTVARGIWFAYAVVKTATQVKIYVDGQLIKTIAVPVNYINLSGVSIYQDNEDGDFASCEVDEFKIYDEVLGLNQVAAMVIPDQVKENPYNEEYDGINYYIDGVNFRDYGVEVSHIDGIHDKLEMKESLRVSWDGHHGEVIDLSAPRYKPREISLDCFIAGNGKVEFTNNITKFLKVFMKPGTRRFILEMSTKLLVYQVYLPDKVEVDKDWSSSLMVAPFKLKLIEPEPIKRLLKFVRKNPENKTVSITLSSEKAINIYWGDNSVSYDIYGAGRTITHEYPTNGAFYILITGVIEDITGFATNAEVVWEKY